MRFVVCCEPERPGRAWATLRKADLHALCGHGGGLSACEAKISQKEKCSAAACLQVGRLPRLMEARSASQIVQIAPGPSGGFRFWTPRRHVLWGGGAPRCQKFGVVRSTRQRITALLGRVGSRARLFSVFFWALPAVFDYPAATMCFDRNGASTGTARVDMSKSRVIQLTGGAPKYAG